MREHRGQIACARPGGYSQEQLLLAQLEGWLARAHMGDALHRSALYSLCSYLGGHCVWTILAGSREAQQ